MQEIVILDFSGIYEDERFYEGQQAAWVDLKDISGTNCYCDEAAQGQILERLEKYPASGIYFIDSGNYHYMSRIGAGRFQEPFNLLVFDNHTDMQLPAFGGLLSCGGWIASALEEVENLREVWLIGPDEEAYEQVEERFKERVHFLSREKLAEARRQNCDGAGKFEKMVSLPEKGISLSHGLTGTMAAFMREIPADLPLYVSIDKDALSPESAATTWSQGDMTLEEMLSALGWLEAGFLAQGGRVQQVDICGECDPDAGDENYKNDHANGELLKFWKECFRKFEERTT